MSQNCLSVQGGSEASAPRNDRQFLLLPRLRAEAYLLLAQFRRQGLSKILGIEDLPDFDFSAAVERRALHPIDRLVQRLHLNQPEARDEIADHGERPMRDG